MKFIASIIMIMFALCFSTESQAQKIYTMTGSGDTVVNTAVEYVSLPLKDGYDVAVFGVKLTKISGTVAGTSILEQSLDNVNFEAATGTDTLTHSNATTNFKNWTLTNPAFPYYRIKITGSGTMSAKVYGYQHVKNISKAMVNRL